MATALARRLTRRAPGTRITLGQPPGFKPNPVLSTDLKMRVRQRASIAVIILYLVTMCLALAIYLIRHGSFGDDGNPNAGVQLFQALAIVQLTLILFVTPASTAGTVSAERRHNTWDLLLVTRLSGFQIIWGKFVGGVIYNLVLALAPLPLYGAPILLGSVHIADILRVYAVFALSIIFLTAISVLVSVLTPRPTISVIISTGISLLLAVGLSIFTIAVEVQPDVAILSDIGQLATPPSDPPPLPLLAQLDPLMALLSVLPDNGGTALGELGMVHHAFGLPLRLTWWIVFGVFAVVIGSLCLAVSSWLVRPRQLRLSASPTLAREGNPAP